MSVNDCRLRAMETGLVPDRESKDGDYSGIAAVPPTVPGASLTRFLPGALPA